MDYFDCACCFCVYPCGNDGVAGKRGWFIINGIGGLGGFAGVRQ